MIFSVRNLIILFFLSVFINNTTAQTDYIEKRNNVGDIPFDSAIDDPTFELIDESNILPYNMLCGFHIKGERLRVLNYFTENFKPEPIDGVTGYITIKFIVNYKGKTNRFRVYEMDNNYQPTTFPENITKSLLELTQKLDGWITTSDFKLKRYSYIEIKRDGEQKYIYDYYQYILFKIKDGQLETILP